MNQKTEEINQINQEIEAKMIALTLAFKKAGFIISKDQAEKFVNFYQTLVEENQKYNLTAITEFNEVVQKHFIDSALALPLFNGKVLDVGSGAGFPGIVLAILNPKLQLTLLDSLNKRVNFLNIVKSRLNLTNINPIHARIEEYKEKGSFDCVTARAVANLSSLSEYLLPFVKKNGRAIIYKGAEFYQELENAQNAIKVLGAQTEEIQKYMLGDAMRAVIVLRKISSCPSKYPRPGNQPRKNPL